MHSDPLTWRNRSPGDLSVQFEEVAATPVRPAVARSSAAYSGWSRLPLAQRIKAIRSCQARIQEKQGELAGWISRETGKPITEARSELAAVVAKFDLTIADALEHVAEQPVSAGPHPASVRRRPRGPAAVVAPFNFPVHLGHGAAIAYLLAGNTVLFKPSPFAGVTCAEYAALMRSALPEAVFELVQGWGQAGHDLCVHPDVRSVCFTGSLPVGTILARELAADYSKSLALELGGKNSALVLADADLDAAAEAVADGFCLTAGQRCNATSRVLVDRRITGPFCDRLLESVKRYAPGDPTRNSTKLGPLINCHAVERYHRLLATQGITWIKPGAAPERVEDKHGWYVEPAIGRVNRADAFHASDLHLLEAFAPILVVETFDGIEEAIRLHNAAPYGLTASVFTQSEDMFRSVGDSLKAGNLYWNLPTTFAPSTLPFGGWGLSGNGKPGGRGFIRFAGDEQAIQWRATK